MCGPTGRIDSQGKQGETTMMIMVRIASSFVGILVTESDCPQVGRYFKLLLASICPQHLSQKSALETCACAQKPEALFTLYVRSYMRLALTTYVGAPTWPEYECVYVRMGECVYTYVRACSPTECEVWQAQTNAVVKRHHSGPAFLRLWGVLANDAIYHAIRIQCHIYRTMPYTMPCFIACHIPCHIYRAMPYTMPCCIACHIPCHIQCHMNKAMYGQRGAPELGCVVTRSCEHMLAVR